MKHFKTKLLAITVLLTLSVQSHALPIVNGILDGGEYLNSFTAGWYNGHNEAGSQFQKTGSHTTTVYWESTATNFYLGVSTSLSAKSMTWGTGISLAQALLAYEHWCSPNDGNSAAMDGSNCDHHSNGFATFSADKTDFDDMTKSEKVLLSEGIKGDLAKGLSGASGGSFGTLLDYKDSVDYVVANIAGCNTTNCDASNIPMTFEFKFAAKTGTEINSLINDIQNDEVEFHLSPEFGGQASVPEPSTLLLLSLGLVGMRLRKRKRLL